MHTYLDFLNTLVKTVSLNLQLQNITSEKCAMWCW